MFDEADIEVDTTVPEPVEPAAPAAPMQPDPAAAMDPAASESDSPPARVVKMRATA
jgi:hypothetical protein